MLPRTARSPGSAASRRSSYRRPLIFEALGPSIAEPRRQAQSDMMEPDQVLRPGGFRHYFIRPQPALISSLQLQDPQSAQRDRFTRPGAAVKRSRRREE